MLTHHYKSQTLYSEDLQKEFSKNSLFLQAATLQYPTSAVTLSITPVEKRWCLNKIWSKGASSPGKV